MTNSIDTARWRRYLRFWRHDARADIDDELRFHLDERTEELVSVGMLPAAARAQAIAEFGDVADVRSGLRTIGERVARRQRRFEWSANARQDIAYAVRSLSRSPSVAITIVLTLALGLGVNVAMFSFLDVVFFRPPSGIAHSESLRRVWHETHLGRDGAADVRLSYAYPEYRAIVDALGPSAATAVYLPPTPTSFGRADDPPKANVAYASADFFPVLGVRPAIGRFYSPDEDRLGTPTNVAVVSDAFWRRELHGDRDAIGATLVIQSRTFTIIGVAPRGFTGIDLATTEIWLPFASLPNSTGRPTPWWTTDNWNGYRVVARPIAGANEYEMEQRLTAALRRPELHRVPDSLAVGEFGSIIEARGPGKRADEVRVATRLAGVAALVLLIACANVLNILIARALRRRREIAVRLALGISRARLAGMLVGESVILALLAAVGALVGAYWGGGLLRALLLPNVRWAESPLHWRVLLFGLVCALVAGIVAGLLCTVQAGAPNLSNSLKAGAREGVHQRSRLRTTLVAAQAALSVVLLVGAVLFVKSLHNIHALDIGFASDQVLFVEIGSSHAAHDGLQTAVALEQLSARLRGLRGIEHVALADIRPGVGIDRRGYYPDADTILHHKPEGVTTEVSPEYFAATGIRLVRGSGFSGFRGQWPPQEIVVNQTMAEALWPGVDPIGRCIRFTPTQPCASIVGVVRTALVDAVLDKPWAQMYVPLAARADSDVTRGTIVIRVPATQMRAAMDAVNSVTKELMPGRVARMTRMIDVLEPQFRPWQLGATLFTLFGVVALAVASIGIYSSVSYAVTQRTHEFGVRIALGAGMRDVLTHVLAGGLRTVGIGLLIGIALTLLLGRLIATLLYGIAPSDPTVLVAASLSLLVVANLAALIPAWRAARTDPVIALRAD